jgi:hypothetical protein
MFVGENCRVVRFSMVKSRFLGTSFERHQTREAATCCDHLFGAAQALAELSDSTFSNGFRSTLTPEISLTKHLII